MKKPIVPRYRLPDGTYTSSGEKLSKAWAALAAPIRNVTGAGVVGYDPGIQFTYYGSTFTLPVSFVERINEAIKNSNRIDPSTHYNLR